MESLLIVLWGFVFGLSAGLTSVGTGSIGTSGLLLLFHIDPKIAIAANLLNGAVMKGFGTVKHFIHKHPKVAYGIPFILGGIPASIVGSSLSAMITAELFKCLIGFILMGVSLLIIWEGWYLPKIESLEGARINGNGKKTLAVISGIIVGFVAGLTSVGTGTLMIAAMLVILRLPSKNAVGTTLFCGVIILGTSALTHLLIGHVDLWLSLRLMMGSIPGVWLGSHFCSKAPVKGLRTAIGIVIFSAGFRLVQQFFARG